MNKKIISAVMAVIMIFTAFPMTAFAESLNPMFEFAFEADEKYADPGDVINYTLSLTGSEDAYSFGWQFRLSIPEGLTYVEGSGKIEDSLAETIGATDECSFTESSKVMVVACADDGGLKNLNKENVLLTFQCRVDTDASIGYYRVGAEDICIVDENADEMSVSKYSVKDEAILVRSTSPENKNTSAEEFNPVRFYQTNQQFIGTNVSTSLAVQVTDSDYQIKVNSVKESMPFYDEMDKYGNLSVSYTAGTVVKYGSNVTFPVTGTIEETTNTVVRYIINYDILDLEGNTVWKNLTGYTYGAVSGTGVQSGAVGTYCDTPETPGDRYVFDHFDTLNSCYVQTSKFSLDSIQRTTKNAITGANSQSVPLSVSGNYPLSLTVAPYLNWTSVEMYGEQTVATKWFSLSEPTSGYYNFTVNYADTLLQNCEMYYLSEEDRSDAEELLTKIIGDASSGYYTQKDIYTASSWSDLVEKLDLAAQVAFAVSNPTWGYEVACQAGAEIKDELLDAYNNLEKAECDWTSHKDSVVISEATETEDGVEEFYCLCGKTKTEIKYAEGKADYTELENYIKENVPSDNDAGIYSEESYEELTKILNKIKYNLSSSEQGKVDGYLASLKTAVENLERDESKAVAEFKIETSENSVHPGDIVDVYVSLKTNYYVSAAQMAILYDSEVFEIVVPEGSELTSSDYIDNRGEFNEYSLLGSAQSPQYLYSRNSNPEYWKSLSDSVKIAFIGFSGQDVFIKPDGRIAKFSLKVREDAEFGAEGNIYMHSDWLSTEDCVAGLTFASRSVNNKSVVNLYKYGQTIDLSKASVNVSVEHAGAEWVLETAPGCVTEGVEAYKCEECGGTVDTRPVPALGHDHVSSVVAPTCTEKGYTNHDCTRCDDGDYVDSYVDSLGHDYKGEITPPTSESQGYTTYTCTRCPDSYIADYTEMLADYSALNKAVNEAQKFYPEFYLNYNIVSSIIDSIDWEIPVSRQAEVDEIATSIYNALSQLEVREKISDNAFKGRTDIEEIVIPEGIRIIGKSAFDSCTALKSVTIPGTVTTFGDRCFANTGITSINISANVETISGNPFAGCADLQEIVVDENNENYLTDEAGVLYNASETVVISCPASVSAENYIVSENVEEIRADAFGYCGNIAEITILNYDCNIYNSVNTINKNTVVSGYKGSTADAYAKKYLLQFNELENPVIGINVTKLPDQSIYCVGDELDLSGIVVSTIHQHGGVLTLEKVDECTFTGFDSSEAGECTVTVHYGDFTADFVVTIRNKPAKITAVNAIGAELSVLLSWGISYEVDTTIYRIYKQTSEGEFELIKEINDRHTLSLEDNDVVANETYSYYVVAIDSVTGAESDPSEIVSCTVTPDVTPPRVTSFTPSTGTFLKGTVSGTIKAEDNFGVAGYEIHLSYDNGATYSKFMDVPANGKFTFDSSVLSEGYVLARAYAYDNAGNMSTSTLTRKWFIDNTAPGKVYGVDLVQVAPSYATLKWNDVDDNDMDHFILKQKKSDGSFTTVSSSVRDKGYNLMSLRPNTTYSYVVAAVDKCGNVGEYSDVFTFTTLSDTKAPNITKINPSASGRYNSSISFSVTAEDDSDISKIVIQSSQDNVEWTDIATKTYTSYNRTQSYSYTVSLSGYEEGFVYLRAVAYDFAGNESDTSKDAPYGQYVVDRTAPAKPVNVTAAGGDGYVNISWTQGSEEDLNSYMVYRSTSQDGTFNYIATAGKTLNYYDKNVEVGKLYYYKVAVNDSCGNVSVYSDIVSARVNEDTEKPVINSVAPADGGKIGIESKLVQVLVSDNSMLNKVVIEYKVGLIGQYKVLKEQTGINSYYTTTSANIDVSKLNHGDTVYVRAYAVDLAGNESGYSNVYKYTVDKEAPVFDAPEITYKNSIATLTWADNGETDLNGFYIYYSVDGSSYTKAGSRSAVASHSYTFNQRVSEGRSYTFKVVALDKVGNEHEQFTSIDVPVSEVANKAPKAVVSAPTYLEIGVEEYFDARQSTDSDGSIVEYLWDFGDGTVSSKARAVKKYSEAGIYTVTLTVTDDDGAQSETTQQIEVVEKADIGTLKIYVKDDSGRAVSYAPVYLNFGEANMSVVYTDASGYVERKMSSGTHVIACYKNEYLPVKKSVVVLSGATRVVSLTIVKDEIVTGEFEVTRMTFDEIVAAGIDVNDPANQVIYSATVTVTYGSTKYRVSYVRNNLQILDYNIGNGGGDDREYGGGGGSTRPTVSFIPNTANAEIIAILEFPVSASFLKEFFDVKLHIVNNAAQEFALVDNDVTLNVPDGMTLMTSVGGSYLTSNQAYIESIQGQETKTLSWVLRGDKKGDYHLSADFEGTLAGFNAPVNATFKTDEPIKVYGMDGIKFRILASDEMYNNTVFFNAELENQRDVDIYMPDINFADKIDVVSDYCFGKSDEKDHYSSDTYLLNVFIQNSNGVKQYLPIIYGVNGELLTEIDVLAPGQKLVYEYVAYNASHFLGTGYLQSIAIKEFEGVFENIEVGSFHKEPYEFKDYSEKLDRVLAGDATTKEAYNYLYNDSNYYYVAEAEDKTNSVLSWSYKAANAIVNLELSGLTNDEKRTVIQREIVSFLQESSMQDFAEDFAMDDYKKVVEGMINKVKIKVLEPYINDGKKTKLITELFKDILKDSKKLTITYRKKGLTAFTDELGQMMLAGSVGLTSDIIAVTATTFTDELDEYVKVWGVASDMYKGLLNAAEENEREMFYYGIMRNLSSNKVVTVILDGIINGSKSLETSDGNLISEIAQEMKTAMEIEYKKTYDVIMQIQNYAEEGSEAGIETSLKILKKSALKSLSKASVSTIVFAITTAFNILDTYFGWGDYVKQQDVLDAYNALSKALASAFEFSKKERGSDKDKASMLILRGLCELRFDGEAQIYSFMADYYYGVYGAPLEEEQIVKRLNKIKNTSYTRIDNWFGDVQKGISRARDIIFNREIDSQLITPSAPTVSLNYETLQTNEVFSSDYEYCFADGVWKRCNGDTIKFTVKSVPSTLRVRKAAGDNNLAGNITTVRIFARKDLSKLITVKFDGVNYLIDNLKSGYNYQIDFVENSYDEPDWSTARTFSGSSSTVRLTAGREYPYAIIRSLTNASNYETTSNPLLRTVAKKMKLNLEVNGGGTVVQSSSTGCYFAEENITLLAEPDELCEFEGWYINGVCVSRDKEYIAEMYEGLNIVAEFTGVGVAYITIPELPDKLVYLEGEEPDITGIKVNAVYENGKTVAIEDGLTVRMLSNVAGKANVEVSYGDVSEVYEVTINHGKGHWIVTEESAVGKPGEETLYCTICGDPLDIREIPSLEVKLEAAENSDTIIDKENKFIYGLEEGVYNLDGFVEFEECTLQYIETKNGFGTGTVVNLIVDGEVYDSYTIVVFGDLSGDGVVDTFDTVLLAAVVNGDIDAKEGSAVALAADVDCDDGVVDTYDLTYLFAVVNGDTELSQVPSV